MLRKIRDLVFSQYAFWIISSGAPVALACKAYIGGLWGMSAMASVLYFFIVYGFLKYGPKSTIGKIAVFVCMLIVACCGAIAGIATAVRL